MESKAPAFVSSAAVTVIFLVCSSAVFLTEVKAFDNMQGSNLGKLQKEIIFNPHFFAQMLGFFKENKDIVHLKPTVQISSYTLTAWRASQNNFLRSRPHNHRTKSSGPFPSGGNKTYQQLLFQRGCYVVRLNSPRHPPSLPAIHRQALSLAAPGIILDWDCSAAFRLSLPARCSAFSPPSVDFTDIP